jgi:nitrite reductase/ring-hydroxylating ferredoxin subunit/uncharacterized membrane protein
MLVGFPLALLSTAFFVDAVAFWAILPNWWYAAGLLASVGTAAAVLAAVPGFVDLLFVVPPQSSAKKRALKHMAVNLTAVAAFGAAVALRPADWTTDPGGLPVLLEAAGFAFLATGGWLGGTLVYANQIGVINRYAHAGRWREKAIKAEKGRPALLGHVDDLKPNQMRLLRVNGDRRIVLARTDEGYVAFDDRCTHKGGSIAAGAMACGIAQCPWHGSQFDCKTGVVKAGPAEKPIKTYTIEERDNAVYLVI